MAEKSDGRVEASSPQRYGTLATALTESLSAARAALESHADLLPEGRIGELDDMLAEFARRRMRVAIYGEVKAGKSTLINAIAGAELSPMAFDPLTSIPLRITYGQRTVWRVGSRSVDSIDDLARIMREGGRAAEVVVETDLDLLQLGGQVDILDTPGVGSEDRFDSISAEVLRSLDAVVLVVRYPALFTQLTRTLVKGLESDIGKLFVVWNLDAACADLSDQEKARHAETLRANAAGAHELCLVDARAGLKAAAAGDHAGVEASGVDSLRDALGRFAASEKREVVALREAAKRADLWLGDAHRLLTGRRAELDSILTGARGRLQGVRETATRKSTEARDQFDELQAEIGRIGKQREAAARARGDELCKQVRKLRRRWIRNCDFAEVEQAVKAAVETYADDVESAAAATVEAARAAGQKFGTVIPGSPRAWQVPALAAMTTEDRRGRAGQGSAQLLRRALWRRWYLPGLAALESEGIERDLASQTGWFEALAGGAIDTARAVLEARLADIARRAEAGSKQIRAEVSFEDSEAEFEALGEHLPVLADKRQDAARVNGEARGLMD